MSIWAAPGVKCVCINDNWPEHHLEIAGVTRAPMLNEILTVAAVRPTTGCLQFQEIPHRTASSRYGEWNVFWDQNHFRPLITKTQEDDVALFRHHLAGAPAGVDA